MKFFADRVWVFAAVLALGPSTTWAQVKTPPAPPPAPTAQFAVVGNLEWADTGSESLSGLVKGPDGLFYGTTNGSGPLGYGTIFSLDPATNALTRVYDFEDTSTSGAYPLGLQRSRFGNYLYGTTSMGGQFDHGTIYRFTPPNQVQVLHSFTCAQGDPTGEITEGPDGMLYGTSQAFYGEPCGDGGLYKFNPQNGAFKQIVAFDWLVTGGHVRGQLTIAADLTIYGAMLDGSAHTGTTAPLYGAIFKVRDAEGDNPGSLEYLYRFTGGMDGAYPGSGLVRGYDGAFYGTTIGGGIACEREVLIDTTVETRLVHGGTIFKITEGGVLSTLYRFHPCGSPGLYRPYGRLLGDGEGRFIGATSYDWWYGGTDGIYEFNATTGGLAVVTLLDINTGTRPYKLALDATNYLYGSTYEGGTSEWPGAGTVFGMPITPPFANWAPFALARQVSPAPVTPTIEATGPSGAVVQLTAQGSYDEDFDALDYEWSNLPQVDALGRPARATEKTIDVTRAFPVGITTVSLAVKDPYHAFPAANALSPSRMNLPIHVVDTVAPVVTPPANVAVDLLTGTSVAVTYGTASATDAVTVNPPVTCSPASGSLFQPGTTTVTCQATDAAGNTGTAAFTVTVLDRVPPVVTVPAPIVVNANEPPSNPTSALVSFISGVSATDNYSDAESTLITCSHSDGLFALGVTTVTCTATDAAGNTGSASFTITVRDATAPVLVQHADMTVEATAPLTPVAYTPAVTATDNSPLAVSIVCAPASGSSFALGSNPVTCNATDAAGNAAAPMTFNVIVVDTTAPQFLTFPTNLTLVATSPSGAVVVYPLPTIKDLVDPTPVVACAPPSGSTLAVGTYPVTCTATDFKGNVASRSFTVTVVQGDLNAPAVTTVPAGILQTLATSPAGAVASFVATAVDDVDGTLPVTCTWLASSVTFPRIGATAISAQFPIGTTYVSCTATDSNGNNGSAVLAVQIVDGGPIITVPATITINAAPDHTAAVSFLATAVDAVDGPRPVTCTWGAPAQTLTFAAGSTLAKTGTFAEGSNVVTCTAVDAHGSTSTSTFVVVVTPPMSLGRFVVLSVSQSWIQAGTNVLSGDVGANRRNEQENPGAAEVRLGQSVTMHETLSRVVGDTVWLQPQASVYNVFENQLLKQQNAVVNGTVTTGLTLPLVELPAVTAITPGSADVTVAKNKTVTVGPGQYRRVSIGTGGTLVLLAGEYQLQSLNLGPSATIRVLGPVDVRIREELSTGSGARIENDPLLAAALPASQIVFRVAGDDTQCRHGSTHHGHESDAFDEDHEDVGPAAVHIGTHSTIHANIVAPRGTVWLQNDTTATGAFIGVRVRVGAHSALTLDSAFD